MNRSIVTALVGVIITQPGMARAADSICARMQAELAEDEAMAARQSAPIRTCLKAQPIGAITPVWSKRWPGCARCKPTAKPWPNRWRASACWNGKAARRMAGRATEEQDAAGDEDGQRHVGAAAMSQRWARSCIHPPLIYLNIEARLRVSLANSRWRLHKCFRRRSRSASRWHAL
jgi:hypothetical protein